MESTGGMLLECYIHRKLNGERVVGRSAKFERHIQLSFRFIFAQPFFPKPHIFLFLRFYSVFLTFSFKYIKKGIKIIIIIFILITIALTVYL